MKQNHIVKSEILWTRACPLNCSYCAMKTQETSKKDWNLWEQGFKHLTNDYGCKFYAFYGAEPLADMEYLPEAFGLLNDLGAYHTLITSCVVNDVRGKLTELYKGGLRSLTVSYDGVGLDGSSRIKSSKGLETLRWFKSEFKDVRDASVVFTLTKKNIDTIIPAIKEFAKEDIYVFFDLIHSDIGNPNSKCRNYPGIKELEFGASRDTIVEDGKMLASFAKQLKALKGTPTTGKYVHQSMSFLDVLEQRPGLYMNKMWNCSVYPSFNAWLTVEHDGTVMNCDDFHIKEEEQVKFWDFDLEAFSNKWRPIVREKCKGCFWNTHFDAHMIKEGKEDFSGYINNKF